MTGSCPPAACGSRSRDLRGRSRRCEPDRSDQQRLGGNHGGLADDKAATIDVGHDLLGGLRPLAGGPQRVGNLGRGLHHVRRLASLFRGKAQKARRCQYGGYEIDDVPPITATFDTCTRRYEHSPPMPAGVSRESGADTIQVETAPMVLNRRRMPRPIPTRETTRTPSKRNLSPPRVRPSEYKAFRPFLERLRPAPHGRRARFVACPEAAPEGPICGSDTTRTALKHCCEVPDQHAHRSLRHCATSGCR